MESGYPFMETLKVYLCVSPAETSQASGSGFPLCHMAYRIGPGYRLYRSGIGVTVRNGMLLLTDYGLDRAAEYSEILLHDLKRECDLRGYTGIVCDFENGESQMLKRFVHEASGYFSGFGIGLYVPISYAEDAPQAHVLIPTDVSGGSFAEHLTRSLYKYTPQRAALFYEPMCLDFLMPSQVGKKDRISRADLLALMTRQNAVPYFSRELGAYYFTYRDAEKQSRFVLFDDGRSMMKKLVAARQAGFREAFLLYADARDQVDQLKELSV